MIHRRRQGRAAARVGLALVLAACCGLPGAGGQAVPDAAPLTPARQAALDAITANSLRGHLSFLASDLLEGRDTPSRGLDIAAEYIAAQFRRAGLEPAGTDGYFQLARWTVLEPDPASFRCEVVVGGTAFPVGIDQVSLSGPGPIELQAIPIVRRGLADEAAVEALTGDELAGRAVVFTEIPPAGDDPDARRRAARGTAAALSRLREHKAAAVVALDRNNPKGTGLPRGRLIDPEASGLRLDLAARGMPSLMIHDPAVIQALTQAESVDGATLTLTLGAPVQRPVTLKNVAGLLPGSDPALQKQYVLVSGHYDHLGLATGIGGGDRIFNGANDDASGTAMVVELATALGRMEPRPRRSILFITFFGEEKGLLGSRFYGRHPLVPIEATVAMLNLEQVGRTDDTEGPSLNRASLTGFDFSDVGLVLQRAGHAVGIEVFKHPRNSDAFFGRSDNQSLADQGVPAHTLCTAFLFSDYHQLGDHWDKVDFENMARVGRAVGLGLMELADAPNSPRWAASNARADRYLKAWQARHPAAGAPNDGPPGPSDR